eukprot:gb/GFBE01051490.1/.p1 GENE.gb/GFBE01051490.1/~~gb/GFBE01051490.1/.p1  ORF type:complete len:175 (+),score=41.68 gb/GFBE01051490.1/:1-525(+)
MASTSRVHRFKALQDLLNALDQKQQPLAQQETLAIDPSKESAPAALVPSAAAAPMASEAALAGLSALLPDSVVQQALHIVDAGGITCVCSELGRKAYEVQGQKMSHLVLPNGLYCSCPYFGRRVLEAGELCCKHWLAVQVAMRCRVGVSSSSKLGEGEFLEWTRQRMVGCATTF